MLFNSFYSNRPTIQHTVHCTPSHIMKSINILTFLLSLVYFRSYTKTLKYYSAVHDEFYIDCFFKKFYVLSSRPNVKQVLQSAPNLSYLNKNFTAALDHLGLRYTINSVDQTDPLWSVLHKAVKDSIGEINRNNRQVELFNGIFSEAIRSSFTKRIDILELFDIAFAKWFCTAFFGNPDITQFFATCRATLLSMLEKSFYASCFRSVPGLYGISNLFSSSPCTEIVDLERSFVGLIPHSQGTNSFYSLFRKHIEFGIEENNLHLDKPSVFVNNSILSMLVYDFLHQMMRGVLISRLTNDDTSIEAIDKVYADNFLFRYRARDLTKSITTESGYVIPQGSTVLIDLVRSKLFFSDGVRGCAGQSMARPMIEGFHKFLSTVEYIGVSSYLEKSNDIDRPLKTGQLCGYIYFRDHLMKSNLIPYTDIGSIKMRNLWHLYSNPDLLRMIGAWISEVRHKIVIDLIIAPEARALPLTTMMSQLDTYTKPVIVLTKTNKFGPAFSTDYTRGYNDTTSTLYLYESFADKSGLAVIIDDGIASGGTLQASIDMVESNTKISVSCVVAIINHTYAESERRIRSDIKIHTMFDF